MDYKSALKSVRSHALGILRRPDSHVRLVAVGSKEAEPLVHVKDFCVTAYVDKKLSAKEMKARGVEPFDTCYAQASGIGKAPRIDTDVVECESGFSPLPLQTSVPQRGPFGGNPPTQNAQKYFHTLRCGIGITNPAGAYPDSLSVGTAGFYMKDEEGTRYVVSNNHVIGGSNNAKRGDAIVQPGTLDLTGLELRTFNTLRSLLGNTQIAQLTDLVQLNFMNNNNVPINRVDAALARLTDSRRGMTDLDRLTFGGVIRKVATPYRVDATGSLQGSARVYKVGRTTGYTEGQVVGIAGTATIPYPGGDAYFVDQIVVRPTQDNVGPFSDRGDSGSAVLNDRHELVGLLYAGTGRHTLVNPIARVVRELRNASGISSLSVIT